MKPDFELPFLTRLMLKFEQATRFGIAVDSISHATGVITIVGATRHGVFTLKHTLVSDGQPQQEQFNLPDIPIWISAATNGVGIQPGQTYLRISLQINSSLAEGLCGGFIYDTKSLDWPYAIAQDPVPRDQGRIHTLSDDAPGAGNTAEVNLTPSRLTKIVCANITLTTSATVANRRVHFRIQGNGGINLDFFSSVDQAASTTRKYTFAPVGTLGDYDDDNDIIVPIMADFKDYDEYGIFVDATNLQAGDAFTLFKVRVEEYMYAGNF
jgi:hypothetical protein